MTLANRDYVVYMGCCNQSVTNGEPSANGIYRLRVSSEGKLLGEPERLTEGGYPSYFCITKDGKTLYAVDEPRNDEGTMESYRTDEEGNLTLNSSRKAAGEGLCHVTLDPTENYLIATCYSQSTIQSYPLKNGEITPMFCLRHHMGSGPVLDRQEKAHAHSVTFTPDGKVLFVCDLGIDKLLCYRLVQETGKLHRVTPLNYEVPAGSGPRHMVFSPDGRFAFVVLELSSELLVLRFDPVIGFDPVEKVSTGSMEYSNMKNLPAAIRLTKDGRHLYVSNRGEDTLDHYDVNPETGDVSLSASYSSRGWHPRDFILTADERFLIAANLMSDNLEVFARDPQSGELVLTDERPVPSRPMCLIEKP